MKKKSFILILALIGLVILSASAFYCHYNTTVAASSQGCEQAEVSGTFKATDSHVRIKADLYLDGNVVDSGSMTTSHHSKIIHLSWSGDVSPGSHTAKVIGYNGVWHKGSWDWNNWVWVPGHYTWVIKGNKSVTFEVTACHDYSIVTEQDADCETHSRMVYLYDYGILQETLYSQTGSWTDPYTIEILPEMLFDTPEQYGEDVSFDALSEPSECLILRTHKGHQASTCANVHRVINLYEGPASNPYMTLVGTHYNETIPFVNPFILETVPAVTVDVPEPYGPDYTFVAVTESAECLEFLDHTVDLGLQKDCDRWSIAPTTLHGVCEVTGVNSGTWSDPYTMETASTSYSCIWDDEHQVTENITIYEPDECLVTLGHQPNISFTSNCKGWHIVFKDDEGGEVTSVNPAMNASWIKEYIRENVTVTITVTWPDSEEKSFVIEIQEPASCVKLEAKTRALWFMQAEDRTACFIFSDTHPSKESQARLCFPCTDPDWVANHTICHAPVYDDFTEFGYWPCDNLVEMYGFDPLRARLWLDDLIAVNDGTYHRPTCQEMGCD